MSWNWKTITISVVGVILLLLSFCFVPSGHVGIVTTFGDVSSRLLDPGIHMAFPWQRIHPMSIRTQEDKEEASVPTKEGLSLTIEVSLLYSLQKDKAIEVFTTVGENYQETVVTSQFRSALRGATVEYEAKDLYTVHRSKIETQLEDHVKTLLASRGVNCEKILFRSITLPPVVKSAVEDKLASEQKSQQMQFVIDKERQEAERKRVEAKGIADAQQIIHETLTDSYLRYLWIESLKSAAEHSATIIYVPTGSDGMPFFKDTSVSPIKK